MKYLLIALALLVSQTTFAQTNAKRCDYTTDGSAKAQGLKVKFQYGCEWKEEESKAPALKTYSLDLDDYGIIQTITISKPETPLTQERIDKMMSEEGLKKMPKGGTFLYGRKLKIDGVDCAEVAMLLKKNLLVAKVSMYMVRYTFPYKGNLVNIIFMVTGEKDAESRKLFNDYKAMFLSMASATDFLN